MPKRFNFPVGRRRDKPRPKPKPKPKPKQQALPRARDNDSKRRRTGLSDYTALDLPSTTSELRRKPALLTHADAYLAVSDGAVLTRDQFGTNYPAYLQPPQGSSNLRCLFCGFQCTHDKPKRARSMWQAHTQLQHGFTFTDRRLRSSKQPTVTDSAVLKNTPLDNQSFPNVVNLPGNSRPVANAADTPENVDMDTSLDLNTPLAPRAEGQLDDRSDKMDGIEHSPAPVLPNPATRTDAHHFDESFVKTNKASSSLRQIGTYLSSPNELRIQSDEVTNAVQSSTPNLAGVGRSFNSSNGTAATPLNATSVYSYAETASSSGSNRGSPPPSAPRHSRAGKHVMFIEEPMAPPLPSASPREHPGEHSKAFMIKEMGFWSKSLRSLMERVDALEAALSQGR